MKTLKLFAVLCCALVCAFTFTSCEKKTTATYTVGLFDYGIAGRDNIGPDYNAIREYLTSKGCPEKDTWTITDASLEKCDQQAKAKFENLVKNLSREEIAEKVSDGFYLTYGCDRSKPEVATIGKWKYPAE